MKTKRFKLISLPLVLLLLFVAWTVVVCLVDVAHIGANDTQVGLATLNVFFKDMIRFSDVLYVVTDWLGLIPIAVAMCFAIIGLLQWIKRGLRNVDPCLFVLGGLYIAVIIVYVFFETTVINYRPVLINGYLESSYPSTTTMLVLSVMPTAAMQIKRRVENKTARIILKCFAIIFTVFTVVGRLVSGAHWISDIVGGAILGAFFSVTYYCICSTLENFGIKNKV